MNRTMLSVVALAVGAVLIIGLYNIYKPEIKGLTHDTFDKVHIQNMGLPEHKWNGLSYTKDNQGNVEITKGKVNKDIFSNKDFQRAKSLKFDNVDTSNLHLMGYMFSNNPNIQSIDFGNSFSTKQLQLVNNGWTGIDSEFRNDPKLKHINFGTNFDLSKYSKDNMQDMFQGDGDISLTGNVPANVKDMYQHRHVNHYPRSY